MDLFERGEKVMDTAVNLALTFLTTILGLVPNSPFMFLFGLAIVLTLANHIFYWILPKN